MEGEREEAGRKEGKVHVKVNWQNLGIDYLGKSQREGRETNKMQTWAIKNLIVQEMRVMSVNIYHQFTEYVLLINEKVYQLFFLF